MKKSPSERAIGRVFMAIGRAHDNRRRDEQTIPLFPLPLILDAEGTLARDAGHLAGRVAFTLKPPRARRRDPATSHQAAASAESFAHQHAGMILAALETPGTAKEIAQRCGLTSVQVSRRGVEMEKAGLVRIGPEVRDGCRVWRRR